MTKLTIKSQYIYTIILISALAWCLLIISAPFFAHLNLTLPAGFIYIFFSKICHQITERSFFFYDNQFAVCARCTGLYFGFLAGTLVYPFIKKYHIFNQQRRYLFFISLIPISIDLSLNIIKLWQNTFFTRFTTGLFLGSIVAFLVIPGLCSLTKTREENNGIKTG